MPQRRLPLDDQHVRRRPSTDVNALKIEHGSILSPFTSVDGRIDALGVNGPSVTDIFDGASIDHLGDVRVNGNEGSTRKRPLDYRRADK